MNAQGSIVYDLLHNSVMSREGKLMRPWLIVQSISTDETPTEWQNEHSTCLYISQATYLFWSQKLVLAPSEARVTFTHTTRSDARAADVLVRRCGGQVEWPSWDCRTAPPRCCQPSADTHTSHTSHYYPQWPKFQLFQGFWSCTPMQLFTSLYGSYQVLRRVNVWYYGHLTVQGKPTVTLREVKITSRTACDGHCRRRRS